MSELPTSGLWSVEQAAAFLGMSRQWLYKQAELGRLPCYRLGARVRFKPDELRAFLEAHRHGPRVLRLPSPKSGPP